MVAVMTESLRRAKAKEASPKKMSIEKVHHLIRRSGGSGSPLVLEYAQQ
jgi:hypothetical protein